MEGEKKLDILDVNRTLPLSIEKELKTSFLDYAMSVIVSRALPDVRDGLKPVHRRILYAMHTLGYYHEKAHRKSATVVGEVIGHYHPHGDQAIYQSIVGLVQTFNKRYPVLDGQGNWGSVDGDNAASMRYTEVKMAKIAREILADIEKETVHFVPNFDESRTEPVVLPSKIPNLLINGANGIAVGMATSIPPHNLREVIDACIALLNTPDLSEDQLFSIIPGPDFPTGGIICGRSGIVKAYRTGHGQVILKGVVQVEETKKHTALIIEELPFQVNKADLISRIADLVKDRVIEGISNIRDESDRRGIRVVIEIKRNENPQLVLNLLYKHTNLQTSLSILLLGLYQNRPMIFTLREMIEHFLVHRKEIILARTAFDLKKSQARAHILHGLMIALDSIDTVIALIKKSADAHEAIAGLQKNYKLSLEQSKAILEMRLQRLTGLERGKIEAEIKELQETIASLQKILNDEAVLKNEIITELNYIKQTYGDDRKTKIEQSFGILSEADLIADEEVVVTLTRKGYIKRVPLHTYAIQHRGGKGKKGTADLDASDDCMQDAFVTRNHDELLFFTNMGRVYSLSVYQVPEATRTSKGRAIVNLLPLAEGEAVVKLLCLREMEGKFIVMVTVQGTIKKTDATAFSKIRSTGIRAIGLDEGDKLAFCSVSNGSNTIVIATRKGMGNRFKEGDVRAMGRNAGGVRAIRLRQGDYVVGMEVVDGDGKDLLFATARGYGKRVRVEDFRLTRRGGVGVRTIPTHTRNGEVIGLESVSNESHILLIDDNGKIIRLAPKEIRTLSRGASGVRLIKLEPDQVLAAVLAFQESGETKNPELEELDEIPQAEVPVIGEPGNEVEPEEPEMDDEEEEDIEGEEVMSDEEEEAEDNESE